MTDLDLLFFAFLVSFAVSCLLEGINNLRPERSRLLSKLSMLFIALSASSVFLRMLGLEIERNVNIPSVLVLGVPVVILAIGSFLSARAYLRRM